jgi:hypothetical protein
MKFVIEIEYKKGERKLWAGTGSIVTDDARYAFKRSDESEAKKWASRISYLKPIVKQVA